MKKVGIFTLIFLLQGCASKAWEKYNIPITPDHSCQTSHTSGYDVYIWECLSNEHVVVYQAQAEFSRGHAIKEKVACGQQTNFEKKIKFKDGRSELCVKKPVPWITKLQ